MSKKSKWPFRIAILSTLLSVAIHIYLTNYHYNFKYGQTMSESLCNINEKFNCDRTVSSPYSEFFGIPISIFGGLINFALFCLLIAFLFPIVAKKTQQSLKAPIKTLSLGIFLVSLVMGGLSVFLLKTLCPFCTLIYLLSFIGFFCLWLALDKGFGFSGFHLKFFGGLTLLVLGLAFLFHKNSLLKYGGKELQEFAKLQMETWLNTPKKDIRPVSPLVINPSEEAKMKMIEFADFLCPHCAKAFFIIHKFIKNHPDVEFSFQAFPRDGQCNPAVEYSVGAPCLLARLSHCAGQQNQTWKVQSWIFENQRKLVTKDMIHRELEGNTFSSELDKKKLMACLESDQTQKVITEQAKLGKEIGITGIPSLYINGKKVPPGFSIIFLERVYSKLNK